MSDAITHGAGERIQPANLARSIHLRLGARIAYPECTYEMKPADVVREGRAYLAELAQAAPEAKTIVETMSGNISVMGMIGLMLPNARIVHCIRDPIEIGLACYLKYFPISNDFSVDLADIGRHIQFYGALMDHWRSVLPNPWLEVRFEDLMGDRDGTVERLNKFLNIEATGGDLESTLLRGRAVKVADYEPYLGPLVEALRA